MCGRKDTKISSSKNDLNLKKRKETTDVSACKYMFICKLQN